MKSNEKLITGISILLLFLSGCAEHDASTNNTSIEALYTMPTEDEPHEGTWLQWPHHYEYDDGVTFRDRMDPTWVAMTKALVTSEKVHIIAYDSIEKDRISQLLTSANLPLSNVDFFIFQQMMFGQEITGQSLLKTESENCSFKIGDLTDGAEEIIMNWMIRSLQVLEMQLASKWLT